MHRVPVFALIVLVSAPSVAAAASGLTPSPKQLAQAINEAQAGAVPYRKEKIAPSDVRAIRCKGYEEEPTEFECTWRHRTARGWVTIRTGFAIDGTGWHVND